MPWLRFSKGCATCCHCPHYHCQAPRKSKLSAHGATVAHMSLSASSQSQSASSSVSPGHSHLAPPLSEFEEVLARRRKGDAIRQSPLGGKKELKILFCLHEAAQDYNVRAMRRAVTTGISQDAQGNKLSIRFSTVSAVTQRYCDESGLLLVSMLL